MLPGFTFSAKNDLRNYAKSHHHIKFALSNFKKKKEPVFNVFPFGFLYSTIHVDIFLVWLP